MNLMIVVPHPDDEVLGFGGLIQRHAEAGDEVFVNFISAVHGPRMKKQYEQFPSVGKLLGYNGRFDRIIPDDENFRLNVTILENNIQEFKPDVLATTFWGDNHQDHEYIFKMIRVATRVYAPFLIKKVIVGEILSSTDQAPRLPQFTFIPTLYVPLHKNQVQKKIKAMDIYDGETMEWPHPRSPHGIMNVAEKRGSECRHSYAEAFMVLRDIKDI